MQNQFNFVCHELIGTSVEVSHSVDPSKKGVTGVILDETLNTFVIDTKNGEKRIPKKGNVFTFPLPAGGHIEVEGSVLNYRPEDRVKKLAKKLRCYYGR